MRKIIVSLIVIVLLGIAALIGILTKKDEAVGWQIYQSSRGFSIKCPDTFNGYSDLPDDTTAYQDGLKSGCIAKNNGLGVIEIVSWTKFTEQIWGKNFTFDDFLKNEFEITKKSNPDFKQEEISLDNNPAIKITYTENLGANETREIINIYSKKDKMMFYIYAVINSAKEKESLPIIERIISTFKY